MDDRKMREIQDGVAGSGDAGERVVDAEVRSQYEGARDNVNFQTMRLEESVSHLAKELSPILSGERKDEGGPSENTGVRNGTSDVVHHLDRTADVISQIVSRISQIREEIEL